MSDYYRDFRSAPVTVMINVRYGNGISTTCTGRALRADSQSVQVVMGEELEEGVHLLLAAPFLNGTAPCYLASKVRTPEWPGCIETELRFYEPLTGEAIKGFKKPSRTLFLDKVDVAVACHELADLLEDGWILDFQTIIESSDPHKRLLYCAVSAMAVMARFQEEYSMNFRELVGSLPESSLTVGREGN